MAKANQTKMHTEERCCKHRSSPLNSFMASSQKAEDVMSIKQGNSFGHPDNESQCQ